MSNLIRLTDRSRTVSYWVCPRKRYWAYEHLGRGIRPESMSLPLGMGIVVHDGLAAIATYQKQDGKVDIDTIANLANTQMLKLLIPEELESDKQVEFAYEQAALVEGMLRGYHRHVWPILLAQYPTIIAIEQEVEYKLDDGHIFMAKPDLLLENESGEMVYVEFKSTSSKKEEWVNSWDTAVQLHSSVKAVEQTLGKAPTFVQIVGLYKGYVAYGKQSSPLVYSYQKKGNPPFTVDQIAYEYKPGFKRYPTWELPGGVKNWVEEMPSEILANQFPMTPPIMVNDDLVERFFSQLLILEKEIEAGMGYLADSAPEVETLDSFFPQRWDQCSPAYGYGCEFKKLCHGRVDDPLANGFSLREPHHAREMEKFDGK